VDSVRSIYTHFYRPTQTKLPRANCAIMLLWSPSPPRSSELLTCPLGTPWAMSRACRYCAVPILHFAATFNIDWIRVPICFLLKLPYLVTFTR